VRNLHRGKLEIARMAQTTWGMHMACCNSWRGDMITVMTMFAEAGGKACNIAGQLVLLTE
jgi:hypothetical protein